MPALVDLHSHIGYEDTATNTEDEENFTRENVIDHLDRYAYTGHALTHSLGNDNPALFDARYADDPAKFTDLRVESQQDSFTGARYYTIGRGLAWEGTGNPRSSAPYPIFKPLQARLAVRELHAQGITFVKLWLVPSATDRSVRIQASELFRDGQFLTARVFRCEHCGHIELFHFPDQAPLPAWEGRISASDRI